MLSFLDRIPIGTPFLRRLLFWLLTTFMAYVLIGFFVIPPVVKSVIQDQMTTELKRQTTVGEVYFNPLTLHIEVKDFNVAKKEGEGPFIAASSLTLAPDDKSIWEFAPVVSYLHIRDLVVDVTFYGEGKYSITDLMGSKQEPAQPVKPEENYSIFPFALYGFEMSNATIIFDDKPHGKRHVISNMDLRVPFTSSIQDQRKEFTQPVLNAVVNGDRIELTGKTLPFDNTLRTEFELGAVEVDLDQYWTYLPFETPLKLEKGTFSSDISLFFERPEGKRLTLFLGGGGKLVDLNLSHPQDGKVISLGELSFDLERYSFGDNQVTLNNVKLDQPYIKLIRDKGNTINWTGYFPNFAKEPTEETVPATEDAPAAPFRIDATSVEINGGILEWRDRVVHGGFTRILKNLEVNATNFSNAADTPLQFDIAFGEAERFTSKGVASVNPTSAQGTLTATGIAIPNYKPYFAMLPLDLKSGSMELSVEFDAIDTPEQHNFSIKNGAIAVRDMTLHKPKAKNPSIRFQEFAVSNASIDLATQTVLLEAIDLTGPMVRVVRDNRGKIDLVETFANAVPATPKRAEPAPATKPGKPWSVTLNNFRMTEGKAVYRDYGFKNRADFALDKMRVNLSNLSLDKGAIAKYDLSTRWNGGGIIAAQGQVTLDSLASKGRLSLRKVGLRPLDPVVGQFTELLLTKGAVTSDIRYTFSGTPKMQYGVEGDFSLNDFQLKNNWGKGEFAGIDAFNLKSVKFASEPFSVAVSTIELDGPRAAFEFDKEGRLNISRAFRIPEKKPAKNDAEPKAKEEKKPAPKPEKEKDPLFKAIQIGSVVVKNGRSSFRDESVTPLFETAISDMEMNLTDIAQTEEARPKLEFGAKIGPSPLTVSGIVNPVITPIYSDLVISMVGLEMVPLSSYTNKYLAYPIEKGRLNADVTFHTENWDLNASNKFFIEQMELGPKDKRPDAPNIPVKFGLALLQDNNGNLRLSLPIEGRLDDPNFRIGGIIFQAIATLFVKALASPFTLIGSMFGGGEEMDFIAFKPGEHTVNASGAKKLETVAKAMADRNKLTLEVDGVIAPEKDSKGLLEIRFSQKLKQYKFDTLSREERSATTVEKIVIAPEEYKDILFEVYADEPDPEDIKPTTLFMTDRQPVDFMEKFIKDRIEITNADLEDLARLRATGIKDHLIAKDPSLTSRIYLLDKRDKAAKDGAPLHRADLTIK